MAARIYVFIFRHFHVRWVLAGLGKRLRRRDANGTVTPEDISILLGNTVITSINVLK